MPGNHDIWVLDDDPRGDSDAVYRDHLPRLSAAHGFHYLDQGPLALPAADLTVVGSINWYDYSWADMAALAAAFSDWEDRLRTKRFTRGRHNDARLVRWRYDDRFFSAAAVEALNRQMATVETGHAIVVTHHPPFRGLNFPRSGPPTPDSLLWDAFAGNQSVEDLLARHAARIRFAFCGHTHRERVAELRGIRGYNVGGDYPFKRLLVFDWPAGAVAVQVFDVRS